MFEQHSDFWRTDAHADIDRGTCPRGRMHRKGFDKRLAVLEIGRNVCFGGGKGGGGGSAPAPDPAVGKAALEQMELGRDWLAFARDQFDIGNARQGDLDALTKLVTQQQIAAQDENMANAREDRNRYKYTFQPLQDEFIKTAKEYSSPAKQEQMAAEAQADVQAASAQQKDIASRNMASMGINPTSGRYTGIDRAMDATTALASAGAANTARQAVRDKGLALTADAINMGSGLPSSTASSYGIGLNAGNAATGNATQANGNWRANVGIMGQGFQGGMQGLQGGAGVLNQQYGTQGSIWSAQQQAAAANSGGLMSGIGSIAGAGIMAF
ncbi:hypothetical protein [Cupriavidus metallidurans]